MVNQCRRFTLDVPILRQNFFGFLGYVANNGQKCLPLSRLSARRQLQFLDPLQEFSQKPHELVVEKNLRFLHNQNLQIVPGFFETGFVFVKKY